MSDRDIGPGQDKTFREVLGQWEDQHTPGVPDFEMVQRRIAASPSPLAAGRWPAGRSVRLAGALAWAQVRIVPWLVAPVALVTATMAVLAARFFGVSHSAPAAVSGFSSLMLFGIAVTITMALSTAKADALSLATPLGPQVVVMARVFVVLAVDAAIGLAASGLVWAWGYASDLSALIASWMLPLAVIVGAVVFVAIWVTPWAGVIAGVVLIPLATPPATSVSFGLGAMSGVLWETLTPVGLLGAGVVLVIAAISSARRAANAGVAPV